MAPACVKLWTQCLQDLQQLLVSDHGPAAQLVGTAVKVNTMLAQWQELPPLSARDWRRLVLEVKVPDVLFAVCCSVVQHRGVQEVTVAAITAFRALYDFFHKGTLQGGFLTRKGLDPNIAHTTNSSSSSNSSSSALDLVSEIRSQVLQSGLMGAFAAAMAAATEELFRYPSQLPAEGTPWASTEAAGASHPQYVMFQTQCQHFTLLLHSWLRVCELWPAGREQVAAIAVAAPAAVQLSAAIMQVVSRDLPAAVKVAAAGAAGAAAPSPQSRDSEDEAGPQGAVGIAKRYATELCSAVDAVRKVFSWLSCHAVVVLEGRDVGMPELRPLLAMPEFTTGLATMVVLMTQALLAQQRLGTSAAATSTPSVGNTSSRRSGNGNGAAGSSRPLPTSSSSSGSTSSGVSSSLFSTKVTRKLEAALQSLPECTKALLKTLGMDSRAMVWAAAALREQASILLLTAITTTLAHVFWHQRDGDQRQQQLLFLVPATLLHWASNTRIKDMEQAQACASIAGGSCQSLINRLCSSFPKQSAQQHDADQQESAASGLGPVTPAELKQLLPDTQKVLAMLLQHSWEHQPSSLPSSSRGVQATSDNLAYCRALGLLARLQCRILQSAFGGQELDEDDTFAAVFKVFKFGVAGRSSRSSSNSSTALQPAAAQLVQPLTEFRSVTVETLASLEGFIRASARQLAAGSMQDALPVAATVGALNAAVFNVPRTKPGPLLSLAAAAAPGSPEQQQLYSLLSSLIKLCALPVDANRIGAAIFFRQTLSGSCLVTACAAIKLMELAQDSESCSSSTATQHSTGPPTAAGSSTAASTSAIALLPSLVLVGRCCLLWAQQLQQALPQLPPVHDAGRGTGPPQQGLQTWLMQLPTAPVLILLCLQPDSLRTAPGSLTAPTGLQSAFSFVSDCCLAAPEAS